MPITKTMAISDFVKEIDHTSSDRLAVVGPMRWQPRDDGGRRRYFIVAYKRRGKFYSTGIDTPDYEPPTRLEDIPEAIRAVSDAVLMLEPCECARPVSATAQNAQVFRYPSHGR
jgi:hypothetical protein